MTPTYIITLALASDLNEEAAEELAVALVEETRELHLLDGGKLELVTVEVQDDG
jgi:hypothetical protein